MNRIKISKPKKLILLISSFSIISLVYLYSDSSINTANNFTQSEYTLMDDTIYPSTIPEEQLLRIDEARKLYESAFDSGVFYGVVNPEKLIEFIKHAWQWDKNAMPYYYEIILWKDLYDEEGKEDGVIMSFDEFMHKYRDKLVDSAGNPLVEPEIYKSYNLSGYLSDKLADLKYPYFAYKKGWGIGFCWYDQQGITRPCSDDRLAQSIKYLNYALEGGYHCYEDLIARMLFQQGDHYKDEQYTQINKLVEHRNALKLADLKQAIDYAELMAEHSSIIGILRVTEAYLYGLGREHDEIKAYAWSLLLDYTRQKLIEQGNNLAWDRNYFPPVWAYNEKIQTRLEKRLNAAQKQTAHQYLTELKTKIIDWNYNKWRAQIDDFSPRP
jgi:TPR repeat protein